MALMQAPNRSPAEGSDAAQVLAAVGPRTPLLLFNSELGGEQPVCAHWDTLALDNQQGAREATAHLVAQGHRRVAFFGGHRDSSSCRQRRAGYREAMQTAGLAVAPHWEVECLPTRLDAARCAEALFAADPAPTAAVCYNDAVALGLMHGLVERGLAPGRDFALTGFDDIAEAALATPSLTTLAAAPRARGRQAAQMLLERLRDPDAAARRIVAPVRLVIRASSCPPPSA
jgi:LacI family transcriptional regulator